MFYVSVLMIIQFAILYVFAKTVRDFNHFPRSKYINYYSKIKFPNSSVKSERKGEDKNLDDKISIEISS